MLNRDTILAYLRSNLPELRQRFSVTRIGLFGSFAQGSEREDRDVDVLVEFSVATFDNYMDLKFHLEAQFGRPVDLVLADSIKPRLKPPILREVAYA